ncbi:hypothetical protein Tco_0758100 [Tanacetum coccineum]
MQHKIQRQRESQTNHTTQLSQLLKKTVNPDQAQKDKECRRNWLSMQMLLTARNLVQYAKECRKPKRVRDSTYHKEKMLLCKQAEKGVQLQAEQSDWLADTDEEIDEQELEAHYSYMAKIHEQSESISNTCAVETGDSNVIPDSPDMCDNDLQNDQHDVECDDERVALANLIANLKLDVDDNKKIQKQLKKANATLTQD